MPTVPPPSPPVLLPEPYAALAPDPWPGEFKPPGPGGAAIMHGQLLLAVVSLAYEWDKAHRDYLESPTWYDWIFSFSDVLQATRARDRCSQCCTAIITATVEQMRLTKDKANKLGIETDESASRQRRNQKSRRN